jgi:hypothetical protein
MPAKEHQDDQHPIQSQSPQLHRAGGVEIGGALKAAAAVGNPAFYETVK